jgi:polysaccharide biosynthesis protein PslJ
MITADPIAHPPPVGSSTGGREDVQDQERTPWLLCVYCFLLPALPTYLVLPGALKGNGAPARMSALIMFGLVVLGFALVRRTADRRRVNPGAVILLIYFAFGLMLFATGALNIDSYEVASSRTRALMGMVAQIGVGLYIIMRTHTARQRHLLLGWLAAGLSYACFVGVVQSVTSINLAQVLEPPGFVLNREVIAAASVFERGGVSRIAATSGHPIEFSVLAAVTIPLTLYFVRNAARRRVRVLSGVACLLAMLALPAAISRSGILSLVAALLVYMFAFKVRPIAISLAVGVAAVGAYVMVFPHTANVLWSTITGSAEDESIESRIDDYARVSELFHKHPIFGIGLGGSIPDAIGFLDNQWLQAIVQGGVIGLISMVLFTGGTIFGISAAMRGATSPQEREQVYMLGAVAIGILSSSFTFDLFAFDQAVGVIFVVFGLLWSGFDLSIPEPKGDVRLPMDEFL